MVNNFNVLDEDVLLELISTPLSEKQKHALLEQIQREASDKEFTSEQIKKLRSLID